jgi:hypothetical protein
MRSISIAMRRAPRNAERTNGKALRGGGRSARRAGTEERRKYVRRRGGKSYESDERTRSRDFSDDDAGRIGCTAGHAIRRAAHRIHCLGRGNAERMHRPDEPVMVPGRDRAEDQERNDHAAGEAALRAQDGKSSHVRAKDAGSRPSMQACNRKRHRTVRRVQCHPVLKNSCEVS